MPSIPLHPGIELRIEDDASMARLIFAVDADVATLAVEPLLQAIAEQKVVVDEARQAALAAAIEEFRLQPKQTEVVIASVVPVVHGEDGRIEWAHASPSNQVEDSSKSAAGVTRVDYYNQAHYIAVTAGSLLGTLHPPSAGCDGVNVLGAVHKAKPGAACPFKPDASINIDSNGRLTAQINGVLQGHDSSWRVVPLFDAPAVNFSTGHIFFKGCVTVRGDVCDRFIVQASEDLTVQGVIGAATVICGRHLQANCGMAAHDRGCLFVAGNATLGYAHNVHGVVQGNLIARKEVINCDLAIGHTLVCDAGAVIGGSIAIGESAVIGVLGSIKGTATTLVFGSDPCRQQIEQLLQTIRAEPAKSAENVPATRAEVQWPAMMERIRACAGQSCDFNPATSRPVNLTVQKFLHPGVIIKTGRCRVKIDQSMRGPVHIHGDAQTGLFYRMGDGVSHPLTDLAQPFKKTG